jgi:ABC-type multidrug transport system fused ATPase/permease subunit
MSAWDQFWISVLAVSVSLLGTLPLEVQRRIVNEAIKQKDLHAIAILALIYLGLVLAQGISKLIFNLYRSWVGANASRSLRASISALAYDTSQTEQVAVSQGVKISMIVSEADAVGNFLSEIVAEPVLEASALIAVFGYWVLLQPFMALMSLVIFIPQMIFVPLMQRAINRRVRQRIAALRFAGADVIADAAEADAARLAHEGRFMQVFHLDMGIFKLKFSLNFLMNLTQSFGTVAILVLGAWFVVAGKTEVGTVVAFLSGLHTVIDPWGGLVNWFQNTWLTSARYGLLRDAVARLADPNAPGFDATALGIDEAVAQASNVPAAPVDGGE